MDQQDAKEANVNYLIVNRMNSSALDTYELEGYQHESVNQMQGGHSNGC